MKNLNGKIVYLVKTTDLVNSKVTQVIASLRLISRAFSVLQKQVSSFPSKVTCHCNATGVHVLICDGGKQNINFFVTLN